jgi:hypothetical protein
MSDLTHDWREGITSKEDKETKRCEQEIKHREDADKTQRELRREGSRECTGDHESIGITRV